MRKLAAFLALALVSANLAACGGGDDSTATTAASTESPAATTTASAPKLPLLDDQLGDAHIRYAASPSGDFAYNVSEASASPGRSRLQFVNPQNVLHNVVIEGHDGKPIGGTKPIRRGITSTHVVLKPGVYVVYCSVPGHRKAGMVGHLTVYPE
jgi:plastocyanin